MSSTDPEPSPIDDIPARLSPSSGTISTRDYQVREANSVQVDHDWSSASTHAQRIPVFLLPTSVRDVALGVAAYMSPLSPTSPLNSPGHQISSSTDDHVMHMNILLYRLQQLSFNNTVRANIEDDLQQPQSPSPEQDTHDPRGIDLSAEAMSGDSPRPGTVSQAVQLPRDEYWSSSPSPRH